MEMTKEKTSELTKTELKELVVEALKVAGKIKLVCKTEGVKFDENRPLIRLDLEDYNEFSVGDFCKLKNQTNDWYGSKCKILFAEPPYRYRIAAFVELIGNLKNGKGIRIKDMFCALVEDCNLFSPPCQIHHVIRAVTYGSVPYIQKPIWLFWVKGLEKVKE